MRTYWVPCPHCGRYQTLHLSNIKAPPHPDKDVRSVSAGERADRIESLNQAHYECDLCGDEIKQSSQRWMVARGVWCRKGEEIVEPLDVANKDACDRAVVMHPERETPPKVETDGPLPPTRRAGFHIWSAYSPWRTWSQILAEHLRVENDVERRRVFTNQWLGEPWREAIEQTTGGAMADKRHGSTPRGVVPSWAAAAVVGADYQSGYLYYIIRAWGPGRQSHLVKEGTVDSLEDLWLLATEPLEKQGGGAMLPCLLAIDSGFRTFEVYDFAHAHPGVYAMRGYQTGNFTVQPRKKDYTPDGRSVMRSVMRYHVNTDYYKEMLHRLAKIPEGEPGHFGLHRDTTDDYIAQFTSEVQVWTKAAGRAQKRRVWQPKTSHARNHFLDCEVYAIALAHFKRILAIPESPEAVQERQAAVAKSEMPPPKRRYGRTPLGMGTGK